MKGKDSRGGAAAAVAVIKNLVKPLAVIGNRKSGDLAHFTYLLK